MEKKIAKKRKGFSTIELGLVLVVIAILLGGVFLVYQKLVPSANANSGYEKVSSVLSGVERFRQSNGGVYPANATAKVSALPNLQAELGGATASADVADWTYGCPAGASSTITIVTTNFDDPTVALLISNKINGNNAPWASAVAGSVLTITKANSTCR